MTGTNTPDAPGRDPVASYLFSLPDAEVTELLADCLARIFAREAPGTQYRTRRPATRPDPIGSILTVT